MFFLLSFKIRLLDLADPRDGTRVFSALLESLGHSTAPDLVGVDLFLLFCPVDGRAQAEERHHRKEGRGA